MWVTFLLFFPLNISLSFLRVIICPVLQTELLLLSDKPLSLVSFQFASVSKGLAAATQRLRGLTLPPAGRKNVTAVQNMNLSNQM